MIDFLWNVHDKIDISFCSGSGVYLKSASGQKYLDFNAGLAVNSLGYSNKKLISALIKQAKKIWHVSNYYRSEPAEMLAKNLCLLSGFERAFFVNSGTEGVEFALKAARKFFYKNGKEKHEIISLNNCYHGRTIGSLSTSSVKKHKDGFGPLLDGFFIADPDINSIKEKITERTAAIIVETIQGNGGMHFLGWDFIKKLKDLARKNDILLIIDETQTGIGRTGKFFSFEYAGVRPDILISAKGIAGGFPFGAVLSSNKVASAIAPGEHGGTFGGNPLGASVALEVVKQISAPSFLQNVRALSVELENGLFFLKDSFPDSVQEIRGFGLMRGIKLRDEINIRDLIYKLANEEFLIVGPFGGNTIRITPPLIISAKQIKDGITKIYNAMKKLNLH